MVSIKREFKVILERDSHPREPFENELNELSKAGYKLESGGYDKTGFWAILSKSTRSLNDVMRKLKEDEVKAIHAIADNDMNVSAAARDLGVHRDTLCFVLNGIAKRTGLNPLNFYDLSELLYPEE